MDQAVSHLWSGVHIICENGWNAEFVQDIATDILSQVNTIQAKTNIVFAKTLCPALNFI